MIRLAAMSSVCPDWNLDQVVEGMHRHGYQGFEPRVEWGHACGIEATLGARERQRIRSRMEAEGLEICCIASGARMAASDPAERAGQIEEVKKYIDLAADLGCSLVRVFGGERDRRLELMAVVDYVVDGFAQVLPAAESRGVTLLLETHDEWCASAPVRAVVEQAGSSHLRILWDFMHPQRVMEEVEESFQVLGKYTLHAHVHDGRIVDGQVEVSAALGAGVFDYRTPLRLLADAGFDGYCSVEVIHEPGSSHDADAVLAQHALELRPLLGT